jgi:hypothetical protein
MEPQANSPCSPQCGSDQPAVTRTVRTGGVSKSELLTRLQLAGVRLNEAALTLFADERFTTSTVSSDMEIVELSVAGLGFREGATLGELVDKAASMGLSLCPMELGPHLRLQFTDQSEGLLGQPLTQNRAPPVSVTIASAPIADDDDIVKGFYLRRMEGILWLRGYRSWPGHRWSPEDRFAFCLVNPT